jgi:hypothetical protein
MKTTLNIDNTVMARLRREAARQNRTISELVEAALRLFFKCAPRRKNQNFACFLGFGQRASCGYCGS